MGTWVVTGVILLLVPVPGAPAYLLIFSGPITLLVYGTITG